MQQYEKNTALQYIVVPDGDWMLLHSDTFISQRDRILLQETSFMIDRDLYTVKKEVSAYGVLSECN